MPQQNYALDVAYQSDIAVVDTTKPISMSYGFVLLSQVGNSGLGEKVDQSINVGDTVIFSVFDTTGASSAAPVTSIVITCKDVTNPNNPSNMDPFGWSTPGTYTLQNPTFITNGVSAGCNMRGFGLSTSWFTAQGKGQGKGQKKTYDITITVNLQNGRVFSVDPEVDIEGVG